MARRSTARASSRSDGGPKMPGPLSCIAPKPIRLIGLGPRNVVLFMRIEASRWRREFESVVPLVVTWSMLHQAGRAYAAPKYSSVKHVGIAEPWRVQRR